MQHIAHLMAIAINGDGAAFEDGVEKVRDPALIFVAELPRPGDAGHAEDDGGQIVDAGVVADVLVGGAFGAAVGRMEIERLGFLDAGEAGALGAIAGAFDGDGNALERSVDLVGGGEEEEGTTPGACAPLRAR